MTALGLFSMAFYGAMMTMGLLSVNMMPQFVISAVIFLTSGRIMKKAARKLRSRNAVAVRPVAADMSWSWLNWAAALSVLSVMAVFMMKPVDVSYSDALHRLKVSDLYYATSVP